MVTSSVSCLLLFNLETGITYHGTWFGVIAMIAAGVRERFSTGITLPNGYVDPTCGIIHSILVVSATKKVDLAERLTPTRVQDDINQLVSIPDDIINGDHVRTFTDNADLATGYQVRW